MQHSRAVGRVLPTIAVVPADPSLGTSENADGLSLGPLNGAEAMRASR